MNKLEKFLEDQNNVILEDRKNFLIALGLTEKEYSPDGQESYAYPKYDYVHGEKRYYREVAMTVSDEEWEQILLKTKQIEEIKQREAVARAKKGTSYGVTKKWEPIFEKPKDEILGEENKEQEDTGKSKAAKRLRIFFWIMVLLAYFAVIYFASESKSFGTGITLFTIVSVCAIFEFCVVEALASILDYLAELTAISRNGYKYNESITRK